MPNASSKFYIVDDIRDVPKWFSTPYEVRDNQALYIYGGPEYFLYAIQPITCDVGFIEEQLKRIFEESEEREALLVEVERWRSK